MMGSDRLVSRTGAGVFVLGVGLLVAAGPGVAVAVASPGGSGDSSSSSSERSRDSDRASASRDRDRAGSSSSSRESVSRADRPSAPSAGSSGGSEGGSSGGSSEDGKDAPSGGGSEDAVTRPGRRSGSDFGSSSVVVDRDSSVEESAEDDAVVVGEPAAVVSGPVAVPEVVAPVSEVVVDPAPVTRVPSLGRAAAGVDRDRLLTLRTVRVQPRVVPVAPSSPVVPEAIGYAGSLTLTRRDLELQATYGDPANAAKYWQPQNSGDCVLMSVAGAIGILTGKAPTEAQIVYHAMNLLSVRSQFAGKMMYRGMRDSAKGAFYEDARNLLKEYGIDSTEPHRFGTWGNPDMSYADEALEKLKSDLADPDKAIIASVYSQILYYKAITGYRVSPPEPNHLSNHALVVTGYDTETDTVIVNDSAMSWLNAEGKPWGQGWRIPREVFMEAWSKSSFMTLVAERPDNPTIPTSAWKNLQPRRDSVALTTAKETPRRSR